MVPGWLRQVLQHHLSSSSTRTSLWEPQTGGHSHSKGHSQIPEHQAGHKRHTEGVRVPELGVHRDMLVFNTHCAWSQMTRPSNTLQGEQITPRGSQRSHRPEGAEQDREPHATHGQRFPPPSACLQTPCAGPGGGGRPSSSRRRRRAGGRTPCPHRRAAGGGRSSGPAPRPRPPVGQEKRREVRRTGPEPPAAAAAGSFPYLAVHHGVLPVEDHLPRGGQHQAPLPHLPQQDAASQQSPAATAASAAQLRSRRLTAPLANRNRALPRPPCP